MYSLEKMGDMIETFGYMMMVNKVPDDSVFIMKLRL